jgi:hypothetical protein
MNRLSLGVGFLLVFLFPLCALADVMVVQQNDWPGTRPVVVLGAASAVVGIANLVSAIHDTASSRLRWGGVVLGTSTIALGGIHEDKDLGSIAVVAGTFALVTSTLSAFRLEHRTVGSHLWLGSGIRGVGLRTAF